MEHVEVLRDLSEVCRAAITAGDWKVDGACGPDAVLRRADAALAALAAPQPPAEAQPVAWDSLFSECICNGGKAGCPGCNPDKAIELAVAIATHDERRKHPPCMECGAATPKEAETKCICSGDKDDCHGCELWPDPDDSEAPSAPVGADAVLRDALQGLIDFIEIDNLPMDADALFIAKRALAQQPALVAPVGVEDLSCCGGNDETPKSHCMDCSRYPGQLAQQPAAVDEAMVELARKARELQKRYYGNGIGLHLSMISWAQEYDALAAQPGGA